MNKKPRYSSTPFNGHTTEIRNECLQPFGDSWSKPTTDEIREVMRRTGLTGSEVAKVVGLIGSDSSRTVRRWVSGETAIPYAVWAILCDLAGIKTIWKKDI